MNETRYTERMKRAFLTGLAALFPILITIFLLTWLYGQMDALLGSKVNVVARRTLVQNERLFGMAFPGAPDEVSETSETRREHVVDNYPEFIGGVVGILGVAFAVLIMGFFLRGFVGAKVMNKVDGFFERFPVVKGIYPHARQVADFLFGSRDNLEFQRVVAVEYPRKGIYSLGFLTGCGLKDVQEHAGQNLVAIFIPNSPAPLTGFVIMVPKNEVVSLDMRVEDAITFCVTAGMVSGKGDRSQQVTTRLPAGGSAPATSRREEPGVVEDKDEGDGEVGSEAQ